MPTPPFPIGDLIEDGTRGWRVLANEVERDLEVKKIFLEGKLGQGFVDLSFLFHVFSYSPYYVIKFLLLTKSPCL